MRALLVLSLCLAVALGARGKVQTPQQSNCVICEYVVTAIETYVENNATVEEVEQFLDNLCAQFPNINATCQAIVNQGIPQIIQWIEQNATPTEVCTNLGLCTSIKGLDREHRRMKYKQNRLLKQIINPKQSNCVICEYVVGAIETYVENNATVQEIEQFLDSLCAALPGFNATCQAIVAQGIPQIVAWLQQDATPTEVCTNLGLCTSFKGLDRMKYKQNRPKQIKKPKQTNCAICEYIVEGIEYYVENNATVQEIEQYLDMVCAAFPQWNATCEAIIAQEVPQIVAWLQNNATPTQVCTDLGLCSSLKQFRKPKMNKPKIIKVNH